MKKQLISNKKHYKVNLHCHTSLSDGKIPPEEVKELYKQHGYSAVAFTDHDIFIIHPELCDEDFIALNGYEIEVSQHAEDTDSPYRKCCHICLVALDPDTEKQVCYHREKYLFGNAPLSRDKLKFDQSLPDFERRYSAECINEIVRRGKEGGFFVTYNHPTWSLEEYPDYMSYEGFDAMEIVNYACQVSGYPEYNSRVLDDMLRGGKKVYCVAADDNHNIKNMFGGFVMVDAEKLEYRALTSALRNGKFYASEGPTIDELWYEDGKVHIKCSPARQVCLICGRRRTRSLLANDGELITEGEFELPEVYGYLRVCVIDSEGRHADSQAYYQSDLES